MNKTINLQSFDTLVQNVTDRYALILKLNPAACLDSEAAVFLNAITSKFDRANVNKLISALHQFPVISELDDDEQMLFINNAQLQLLSHKIKLSDKRFIQANVILSSVSHCEIRDVIVWCGEPVLVGSRNGEAIETFSIDKNEEDESMGTFTLGFHDEPHFILGQITDHHA